MGQKDLSPRFKFRSSKWSSGEWINRQIGKFLGGRRSDLEGRAPNIGQGGARKHPALSPFSKGGLLLKENQKHANAIRMLEGKHAGAVLLLLFFPVATWRARKLDHGSNFSRCFAHGTCESPLAREWKGSKNLLTCIWCRLSAEELNHIHICLMCFSWRAIHQQMWNLAPYSFNCAQNVTFKTSKGKTVPTRGDTETKVIFS